jgi:hypothetical protein
MITIATAAIMMVDTARLVLKEFRITSAGNSWYRNLCPTKKEKMMQEKVIPRWNTTSKNFLKSTRKAMKITKGK